MVFLRALYILLLGLMSCGGGTRGTGDISVTGSVQSTEGTPLSNATVTILETGDSATTDTDGNFSIVTNEVPSTSSIIIEKDNASVTISGEVIPSDTINFDIEVTVDIKKDKPTGNQKVKIKDRRQAPSPTKKPEDRSSPDKDTNTNETDDDKTDSSKEENKSDDSKSDRSDSEDKKPDDSSDNSSDTSNKDDDSTKVEDNNSKDDVEDPKKDEKEEDIKVKGKISSISSSSITVAGTSFQVNSKTEYDNKKSISEFSVGDNVEVEGKKLNGVITANKIKFL